MPSLYHRQRVYLGVARGSACLKASLVKWSKTHTSPSQCGICSHLVPKLAFWLPWATLLHYSFLEETKTKTVCHINENHLETNSVSWDSDGLRLLLFVSCRYFLEIHPSFLNSVFPSLLDICRITGSLLTSLFPLISASTSYFPASHPISSHLNSGASCFPPSRADFWSQRGSPAFKGDTVYLSFLNCHVTSVWGVCQTSQVHWDRVGSWDLNELHIRWYRSNGTPAKTRFWIQVVNAAVTTINIRPTGEKLCWSLLKMETWI